MNFIVFQSRKTRARYTQKTDQKELDFFHEQANSEVTEKKYCVGTPKTLTVEEKSGDERELRKEDYSFNIKNKPLKEKFTFNFSGL